MADGDSSTNENWSAVTTTKIDTDSREKLYFDPNFDKNSKSNNEIVDIVNDYAWTNIIINKSKNSITDINNNEESSIFSTKKTQTSSTMTVHIPFAICIERKQAVASNIMNLIGAMVALKDSFTTLKNDDVYKNKIDENIKKEGEGIISAVTSTVVSNLGKAGETTTEVALKIFSETINQNTNLNTDYLRPYKFLYGTIPTGKSFVFPVLNDMNLNATNSWVDEAKNNGQGLITGMLSKFGGPASVAAIGGSIRATYNEIDNFIQAIKR